MSWTSEIPVRLRQIIGDINSTSYSDDRLKILWLLSVDETQLESNFNLNYSVDISATGISPDPTLPTRDSSLIVLSVLKAACILANAELKAAIGKSVTIKDGISQITLSDWYKNTQALAKAACDRYQEAFWAQSLFYASKGGGGRVINSPFSSENLWFSLSMPEYY